MADGPDSLFPSRKDDPLLNSPDASADAPPASDRSDAPKEWEVSVLYPGDQTELVKVTRALNHGWSLDSIDLSPVTIDSDGDMRAIRITFHLRRDRLLSLFEPGS
jgi:hypothetical protein